MADRTIIKLDGKLIEVNTHAKTKNGVTARALNEQEAGEVAFDAQVLGSDFDTMLKNDFNSIANQAYEELKQNLKANLKMTIFKTLGFEDDWGRGWKVDHCNGRMSEVTSYIADRVKTIFREESDKLITKADIDQLLKKAKEDMLKSFKETFMYECRCRVQDQAKKAAQDFLTSLVKDEVETFRQEATVRAKAALLGRVIPKELEEEAAADESSETA